jgi:hypothetical protein
MSGAEEINVQPNGVTVGWRLVVAVGALLLGYYVATQVAPLHNGLKEAQDSGRRVEARLDRHSAKLDELGAQIVQLQIRMAELGAEQYRHDTAAHPFKK